MRLMLVPFLVSVLLVIGCAVTRWEQSGKTRVQVEEDFFVCEDKAYRDLRLTSAERDKLIDKCMAEKGYRRASSQ